MFVALFTLCPKCNTVATLRHVWMNEAGTLRMIHTCDLCNLPVTRDVDAFEVAATVSNQLQPSRLARETN